MHNIVYLINVAYARVYLSPVECVRVSFERFVRSCIIGAHVNSFRFSSLFCSSEETSRNQPRLPSSPLSFRNQPLLYR